MSDILDKLTKHTGGLCTENPEDYATFLSKDVVISARDEIVLLRQLVTDMLYAWDWWNEDPYDRESPSDEIYQMKKYMKSRGYKVDRLGIVKINNIS